MLQTIPYISVVESVLYLIVNDVICLSVFFKTFLNLH